MFINVLLIYFVLFWLWNVWLSSSNIFTPITPPPTSDKSFFRWNAELMQIICKSFKQLFWIQLAQFHSRKCRQAIMRELLICTTNGFCDGKTSNVASSPRRLSGSLRVVEPGGPMDDKFDTCTHEWNWHPNHPRIIGHANQKLPIMLCTWTFLVPSYNNERTTYSVQRQFKQISHDSL